jgi:hypothetical protein
VGTYFHPLFPAFPRLHFQGPPESAKSKALQIISALAFNGLLRLHPTPAVLYRLIGPLRPTLCLDETETLDSQDRKDLLAIVNAGYKADGAVDRCEGKDYRVTAYQVYSPMALASISGLNHVTESRAITILMDRGQDANKVNREVNTQDSLFQDIRAECYRLTLSLSGSLRDCKQSLVIPSWLKGRHRELYAPLLAVATLAEQVNDKLSADVLNIAKSELHGRPAFSLEEEAILCAARDILGGSPCADIRPRQLLSPVATKVGRHVTPERIGHVLRRFRFERNRDKDGTTYRVTKQRLEELTSVEGAG